MRVKRSVFFFSSRRRHTRCALVTGVQTCALPISRVSAHLKRWGIEADDSAGRPLSELPAGTLLVALAEAAAERFAPVALLALLKHPLVKAGDERLPWLEQVRRFDLLLRGPRPPAGLAGIDQLIALRRNPLPQDRKSKSTRLNSSH